MAILVEIQGTKAAVWRDTSGVKWIGTAGVDWIDGSGGDTLYLSLTGEALDPHYWDALISSFTSVSFNTAKSYGGLVDLDFGQINIIPTAFNDDWPPPKQISVVIKYTATTEAAAVTLFSGDCYRGQWNEQMASYSIKPKKFTQKLLDLGPVYGGDTLHITGHLVL